MSAKSIISNSYLEDIGDAIRYKKGTDETFYPSQMGDAIRSIEGIVPVGSIDINANGVYDVTEKASVDVNVVPDLRPLSVSENGTYEPDDFDGYSDVTVDVEPNLESLNVTENGLYLPTAGVDGYDRVNVDVPIPVPDLVPLDVTSNGQYLPTGHDGFSEVNVTVPTGGGGGLTLIDTIEVNGVRGVRVDIDVTWFDDVDYVLLVPDLTFSASDWLYIVNDATSGGGYAPQSISADSLYPVFVYQLSASVHKGAWFRGNSTVQVYNSIASYLYWYLYGTSNTMTGTIKVYGIKLP